MSTIKKQELLINYICSSNDILIRTNAILDETYFDPKYQPTILFIKEYYDKYKALPNAEQLQAETDYTLKVQELCRQEIRYATDEIEMFCRNKAIQHAVLKAPQLIADGNFSEVEKTIKEAIMVGISSNIGISYFDNPEERLRKMLLNDYVISTGWTELDTLLNGGISKKEMTLFMANCVSSDTRVSVINLPNLENF